MNLGPFDWKGASGETYTMDAYTLDTEVNPEVCGNYIFGRLYKDEKGQQHIAPIYIGEGVLKDRISFRINEGRVQAKGCNCFCAIVTEDEARRKFIEEDLLAACPQAYEPVGCNIRIGG